MLLDIDDLDSICGAGAGTIVAFNSAWLRGGVSGKGKPSTELSRRASPCMRRLSDFSMRELWDPDETEVVLEREEGRRENKLEEEPREAISGMEPDPLPLELFFSVLSLTAAGADLPGLTEGNA